jgi:hypothetical protein
LSFLEGSTLHYTVHARGKIGTITPPKLSSGQSSAS